MDPTPTALYHTYLAEGQFEQTLLPESHVHCLAELPEPFLANPDIRYWIEIQGVLVFPPCYGALGAIPVDGWGATLGSPIHEEPYWSRRGYNDEDRVDIVFTLYSQSMPHPDVDRDGDVDMDDYLLFQTCFSGDGYPYDSDRIYCQRSDLDADIDVDLLDFSLLQDLLAGPGL